MELDEERGLGERFKDGTWTGDVQDETGSRVHRFTVSVEGPESTVLEHRRKPVRLVREGTGGGVGTVEEGETNKDPRVGRGRTCRPDVRGCRNSVWSE